MYIVFSSQAQFEMDVLERNNYPLYIAHLHVQHILFPNNVSLFGKWISSY